MEGAWTAKNLFNLSLLSSEFSSVTKEKFDVLRSDESSMSMLTVLSSAIGTILKYKFK